MHYHSIFKFYTGATFVDYFFSTKGYFKNEFQKRASGEIQTLAHWMREYVQNHASYKMDSYVNDRIIYDMLKIVGYWFFEILKANCLDGRDVQRRASL